nr:hypothetical protein CFP56_06349 [Quercus suber]
MAVELWALRDEINFCIALNLIDVIFELDAKLVRVLYLIFNQVCLGREIKMGFVMEFAENLILKLMEDPKERDKKFREHLYAVKDRCTKTKEMWSYPLRPYGFWTFEQHNVQLSSDAQISEP